MNSLFKLVVVLATFADLILAVDRVLGDTGSCDDPPYKIHILSKSPLVIYISNFITSKEREHLQELA
jgi:prolyl 4-hydroxylase